MLFVFVFLGGMAVSVAEYWFTRSWWLNSGQGVATMVVSLALASIVVGAIFRRNGRQWARAAGLFAAGAFGGQAVVLFLVGPGTIFPIVLFFCGVFTFFAVGVGASVGYLLRRARR
jgi:hypothetical protein